MPWFKFKRKYQSFSRKNWLYLLLGLVLLVNVYLYFFQKDWREVKAGNCLFKVEIVSHPREQYLGLSNRDKLALDQGMLFLFPTAADRSFVMRNMRFPLDIIFIRNNRIINLYHNLPPEGAVTANTYHSGSETDAVLEINAGRSNACHLGVGSEIVW